MFVLGKGMRPVKTSNKNYDTILRKLIILVTKRILRYIEFNTCGFSGFLKILYGFSDFSNHLPRFAGSGTSQSPLLTVLRTATSRL